MAKSYKLIYNNFIGGLSTSERDGPGNSFPVGREVDIYGGPNKNYGYLMPGNSFSNITPTASILDLIVDFTVDPARQMAYGIGDNYLYQFALSANTMVTAGNYFPHGISGAAIDGISVCMYPAKSASASADRLFYSFNNATSANVGTFNLDATFDDDFMSTKPVGATGLSVSPHPMVVGEDGILYIGNGYNLSSYDGQTGDGGEGTFTNSALDLPLGWEITALFKMRNHLGICAWIKGKSGSAAYRSESAIFLWDYASDSWNQMIPVDDTKICAAKNHNGVVYIFTYGRGYATLRQLSDYGAHRLKEIRTWVGSTYQGMGAPKSGAVDSFNNQVIFGVESPYAFIFSYGKLEEGLPDTFALPWGAVPDDSGSSQIGALKTVAYWSFYVSVYDGTNYWVRRINTTGYSTNATWKGRYSDFPQKVRINYVKFYFRPLASGDVVTPTLDIDYGTSVTLKDANSNSTIAYSTDGAATTKKFKLARDCHSVRPCLAWSAGSPTISKIVIDYSPIED